MATCEICREQEIAWAWKPFGPDDDKGIFAVPDHHYRGFPYIKICESCGNHIRAGHDLRFTYKGEHYVYDGIDNTVMLKEHS